MSTSSFKRLTPTALALYDGLADGDWHTYGPIYEHMVRVALTEEADKCTAFASHSTHTRAARTQEQGARDYVDNLLRIHSRRSRDGRTQRIEFELAQRRRQRIRICDPAYALQYREWRGIDHQERVGHHTTAAGSRIKLQTFAGTREDQGWGCAPLHEVDIVSFDLTNIDVLDRFPTPSWAQRRFHASGWKAWTTAGRGHELLALVRDWLSARRVNTKVLKPTVRTAWRRDITELPQAFLSGLATEYQARVSKRLHKKHFQSLQALGMDYHDVEGLAANWVIDAVTRYNPQRGAFGPYCMGLINEQLTDEVRRLEQGRSAANTAKQVRQAEREFRAANNDRPPTDQQLADHLQVPLDTARSMRQVEQQLYALRTAESVDATDDEGNPMMAHKLVDHRDASTVTLSEEQAQQATRHLITACTHTSVLQPQPDMLLAVPQVNTEHNVIAFLSFYYAGFEGWNEKDIIRTLGVSESEYRHHITHAEDQLKELHHSH